MCTGSICGLLTPSRGNSLLSLSGSLTLFSMACFSFSTLARVISRSSMSFFSSAHSSSSLRFLASTLELISSSSSSLSKISFTLASSWILALMSRSHRSSASARLSCSYGRQERCVQRIPAHHSILATVRNCHLPPAVAERGHSSLGSGWPASPPTLCAWPQTSPGPPSVLPAPPSEQPALSP